MQVRAVNLQYIYIYIIPESQITLHALKLTNVQCTLGPGGKRDYITVKNTRERGITVYPANDFWLPGKSATVGLNTRKELN